MSDESSIARYYGKVFANIKRQILSEKDEYIIGTDIDELAEYYYSNNCLSPIEFDIERLEIDPKKELRIVKAHERGAKHKVFVRDIFGEKTPRHQDTKARKD